MYTLRGVTKQYRKNRAAVTALDRIDLDIPDGQFLAIRGRTGSGKSTLLQILGAMDQPTAGQVCLDRADLGTLSAHQLTGIRAASIGFVFQAFNLIPTLSAIENVQAALVPLGVSGSGLWTRAEQALESVGLADRAHHLPSELSGGQQQRVGIARALAKEPAVLLADEPTGNLDTGTRDEIIALLERLWQQRRLTLVLVTHDAAVAARAQRVVTLSQGRLADGPDGSGGPDGSSRTAGRGGEKNERG
jgi:putative ABC transport system ATP-binding protein